MSKTYPSPTELSDEAIKEAIESSGVDRSRCGDLESDQVRLAYEYICAQLDYGNSDGRNYVSKHIVEAWAGYYIPQTAVDVAMHLAGISGLANKQIFHKVERLGRHAKAGTHSGYSEGLSYYSHNRAEADSNGKLAYRQALELHREFMAAKGKSRGAN